MVGYPDCRDRFRNPVCTAVKANLPNKGKAFGEPIIQDKKTFACGVLPVNRTIKNNKFLYRQPIYGWRYF